MKQITITLILLAASAASIQASAFLDSVDLAWRARSDGEILQLANAQAQNSLYSIEVQAVLFKYNLLVAGDKVQAMRILDAMITRLSSVHSSAVPSINQYRSDLLLAANGSVVNATPTVQQLEALHRLFPSEFPVRSFLVLVSDD